MRLPLRLLFTAVVLSIPVAVLAVMAANGLRNRDAAATIERIVNATVTQHQREACEADPNWFLAGPRDPPPTRAERLLPDADVRLPRPSTDELPFEYYAYNELYEATSTAAPRFPVEFKAAFRSTPPVKSIKGSFATPAGEGVQMARSTGWSPGPCAVLLFRWRPLAGRNLDAILLFTGVFIGCLVVSIAAGGPIVWRIRQLQQAVRHSARQDYGGIVPANGGDEIGSLGAMFNETGADIRRRITESKDREEALRRYVTDVTDGVAGPLADLESRLAAVDPAGGAWSGMKVPIVQRTHELSTRLLNLAAVARLRTSRDRLTREPVDMNAIVSRIVTAVSPFAEATGVTVSAVLPKSPAVINGDPVLLERAIANLVENGVLYNRPGGRVNIEIAQYEGHGRFSLRVNDTGRGVTDEEFTGLTAIRRFRGDEGRERRAGVPGLGLAVAREVAERFGFGLELRRPAAGGFEAEFAGSGTRADG